MNYGDFYSRITKDIRRSETGTDALIYFNMYFTYAMYLLYPCLLVWTLLCRSESFAAVLTVPAVSFAVLTAIRKMINRPRPYETWKLDILLNKQTKGCSMPSRHVFSAVVISFCIMRFSFAAGLFLLGMCVLYAMERVLIGVHYPSDVIVGYAAGIAAGLLVLSL